MALCDVEKNIRMPFDYGFYSRKKSHVMSSIKDISEKNVFLNGLLSTLCKDQNEIPDLYIDPKSAEAVKVAVSTDYMMNVKSGKIVVRRNEIKQFNETGVVLNDNTHSDVVLFCIQ